MTARRPAALAAAAGAAALLATAAAAAAITSPAQPAPPPAASAAAPAAAPAAGPRQAHTPGHVTDDMHLTPGQCHLHTAPNGQPLPDPACTPGATDPAVTQDNIHTTICAPGYTATIRPPAADTDHWKTQSAAAYGITGTKGEYDHLVSLELGGANTTSNLWVQPGPIPNDKDQVENRLHAQVCAGTLTLAQAQQAIAADWTTAR